MTDKELIEAIKGMDLKIETIEEKIEHHKEELGELRCTRAVLNNALLLRMADRMNSKKIFCCFRRSKG